MATYVERYAHDPVRWHHDIILSDPLEWYQAEAMEKLDKTRFVTMACGGGVGKTFTASMCIHWFLTTRPYCNIIITAPTKATLESVLWKELLIWKSRSRGDILNMLEDNNAERLWVKGYKESWFAMGRTGRKDTGSDVSEALSGIHSDYGVLFIVDEACLSSDTEILTNNGWKNYKNINKSDKVLTKDVDGNTTFIKPHKYFKKHYTGDMINFKNKSCDLLVTPNHNMVVQNYKKQWIFKSANDLSNEVVFSRNPELRIEHTDDDTTYEKLLGWYISEGNIGYQNNKAYSVIITQKSDLEKIAILFDNYGLNPKIYRNSVVVHNTKFAQKMEKECGSGFLNKRIPRYLFDAPQEKQRAFLDAFLDGDGYIKDGNRIYYTSSKELADDIQELILRSGSYATLTKREIKGQKKWILDHWATSSVDGYVVRETKGNIRNIKVRKIEKVSYDDYVWCVEVKPSHLIYVRRNGYCAWVGNSGVDESVFGAIEGSFTSANSYCLLLSNPTRASGSFFRSHHQERHLWHQIQVGSHESARVDKMYVDRMKTRFGEHHPVYRAKVLGLFPRDLTEEMSIFGEELGIMEGNTEDEIDPNVLVIGLDVSRYGSDLTVMVARRGYEVIDIVSAPKMDTVETAEWAWKRIMFYEAQNPNHPIEINIDAVGIGAGVADTLKYKVRGYNRNSKSRLLMRIFPIEYGRKSDDMMYANVRAESFFAAKEMMKKCRFKEGLDWTVVENDLKDIKFEYDKWGKLIVESKEDIKKRRHGVSPDFGDAFILAMNNYSGKNYESVRKKLVEEAKSSHGRLISKQSLFSNFGSSGRISSQRWSG